MNKSEPAARFTNIAPKNWKAAKAKSGPGTKYVNPKNSTDYVRFSSKNMHPNAPAGQKANYFQRHRNGKVLTRSGRWVNPKDVNPFEYHIPQDMYNEFSHLMNFK